MSKLKTFFWPLNKVSGALLWILLWFPVSALFPSHPDFPFANWMAPLSALLITMRSGFPPTAEYWWAAFQLYYGAALFFWVGLALIIRFLPRSRKTV